MGIEGLDQVMLVVGIGKVFGSIQITAGNRVLDAIVPDWQHLL
jgi:hypothetical protein